MRNHDLELVAALVEGRLEDETEARALIASSGEAREEYEAQKLAYQSLRSMGTAHLTERERAALHQELWTDLRKEAPVKGRSPWYYRWAPVAAGLFVVVGVAAVLSGGGQEVATTFREMAAELGGEGEDGAAATTTTAAGTADLYSDAAGGAEQAPATDTTEAMSETTFAAEESDDNRAFLAAEAARVRERVFTARLQGYDEAVDPEVDSCLEQAGLTNYGPVATYRPPDTAESDLEGLIVVAAPEQSVLAESPLAFVDVSTCELVYFDEVPD